MTLCPVCLAEIEPTKLGANTLPTVNQHMDSIGRICPMSGQEMPVWDEYATRRAVKGRSSDICEYCSSARATDMHHRISRGVGGWWSPANIIHICRGCHGWFTDHPDEAYQYGVSLRRSQEPELVPMMTATGELRYLSDKVAA